MSRESIKLTLTSSPSQCISCCQVLAFFTC
jgi:hypothetical protein